MNDDDLTMICGHVTRGAGLQTACELVGITLDDLFDTIGRDPADLISLFSAMIGTAHLRRVAPPSQNQE